MKYTQISLITTHEAADLVSLLLIDNGSEGTVIKDREDIKELYRSGLIWDYIDDNLIEQEEFPVTVIGFFPENFNIAVLDVALNKLKNNCDYCGSLEMNINLIDSLDWENEWKKFYKPIQIDKVLILPKWLKTDADGIVVKMDPGMAFGTGNHETTAACIELMQTIDLKDKIVFDVGCGSGILGICAAKLSAKHVFMSDIDRIAIDASRENVFLNEVECKITLSNENPKTFGMLADLIVANITADILMSYRNDFYDCLTDSGYLILSGIILSRYREVSECYVQKFQLLQTLYRGEWCAMILRKL